MTLPMGLLPALRVTGALQERAAGVFLREVSASRCLVFLRRVRDIAEAAF